jgi:hypothetical protein
MARRHSLRLTGISSRARGRLSAARRAREEGAFQSAVRVDPHAPELLLSPHPDDAALSCWSVLARDGELVVANLFAGIPAEGQRTAWEGILGVADTAARARLRLLEDERALAGAGRSAMNLPLLDSQLRGRGGGLPSLQEVDGLLAHAVPAASRVYAPAGIGGQGDHLLARRYALGLLREGMPVTLYAELPYCIFHGWPAWVNGAQAPPDRDVDAYWSSFLERVSEMPPLRSATVERLAPSDAAAKREAIASYHASLNYAARQMLSDPAFHGFEVRWELKADV